MQTIFRVHIQNAGLLNVNANHHRHRPEFMYMHLAKDPDQEFAIYLQPLPEMGFAKKQKVSPKAELIELSLPKKKDVGSPLKKAIDAANHDEQKMKELMFDLDGKSNKKVNALSKGSKSVAKHVNVGGKKHHIVQPGASKNMRRVRGE